MHACEVAAIVRQRYQRGLIVDVSQVHSEPLLTEEQIPELGNRKSVTRVLRFQFLGKVLELWSKPRLEPLARPDELVTERCQGRTASLPAFNQRCSKIAGPLLDQIPRMAIRQAGPGGGMCDFPGDSDPVQKIQHDRVRRQISFAPEAPGRLDFDSDRHSRYAINIIFLNDRLWQYVVC